MIFGKTTALENIRFSRALFNAGYGPVIERRRREHPLNYSAA